MLKYLKLVFLDLFRIIFAYFGWILRYSWHPEKYPIEVRFRKVQKLVSTVVSHFNMHYEAINWQSFQREDGEEPRLIVCNHLSDLDPLIFIILADKPISFVAKKEVRKFPVVGRICRILDAEFMDRDDLKQSLRVMKSVEEKLSIVDGFDYVIFPEGTRNKEPLKDPAEFHHGSFRAGYKANANILNCALYGTPRVISKRTHFKKYPVEIKYISKYTKEDYEKMKTPDIALDSHKQITETVNELRKTDEALLKELN